MISCPRGTVIHNIDHQPFHLCIAKPGKLVPFNFSRRCDDLHVRVITSWRARNLPGMKVLQHRIAKAIPRHTVIEEYPLVGSVF